MPKLGSERPLVVDSVGSQKGYGDLSGKQTENNCISSDIHTYLVGGFNPSEKYESQWEGLSHIYILWKIKNVPNHPPDINWDTMDIPPTLTFFYQRLLGGNHFLRQSHICHLGCVVDKCLIISPNFCRSLVEPHDQSPRHW